MSQRLGHFRGRYFLETPVFTETIIDDSETRRTATVQTAPSAPELIVSLALQCELKGRRPQKPWALSLS